MQTCEHIGPARASRRTWTMNPVPQRLHFSATTCRILYCWQSRAEVEVAAWGPGPPERLLVSWWLGIVKATSDSRWGLLAAVSDVLLRGARLLTVQTHFPVQGLVKYTSSYGSCACTAACMTAQDDHRVFPPSVGLLSIAMSAVWGRASAFMLQLSDISVPGHQQSLKTGSQVLQVGYHSKYLSCCVDQSQI
jgi:hypothetical protein